MDVLDPMDNVSLKQTNNADPRFSGTIFPTLVTRIKAIFIDLLIIFAVFIATTLFIDNFVDLPDFIKGFILVFMFYLYDPFLTAFTGGTLGHKLMKLKVKRYENPEQNISITAAFLRFLTKGLLGWLSFLTVTGHKHKRAIHDFAGGSIILSDR